MHELLEELNKFWNPSGNRIHRGEHPRCDELHEEIIDELQNMSHEEIEELLSDMDIKQLEQIRYPLEEIEDDHPEVTKYIDIILQN